LTGRVNSFIVVLVKNYSSAFCHHGTFEKDGGEAGNRSTLPDVTGMTVEFRVTSGHSCMDEFVRPIWHFLSRNSHLRRMFHHERKCQQTILVVLYDVYAGSPHNLLIDKELIFYGCFAQPRGRRK
jgi:hypothetical protein